MKKLVLLFCLFGLLTQTSKPMRRHQGCCRRKRLRKRDLSRPCRKSLSKRDLRWRSQQAEGDQSRGDQSRLDETLPLINLFAIQKPDDDIFDEEETRGCWLTPGGAVLFGLFLALGFIVVIVPGGVAGVYLLVKKMSPPKPPQPEIPKECETMMFRNFAFCYDNYTIIPEQWSKILYCIENAHALMRLCLAGEISKATLSRYIRGVKWERRSSAEFASFPKNLTSDFNPVDLLRTIGQILPSDVCSDHDFLGELVIDCDRNSKQSWTILMRHRNKEIFPIRYDYTDATYSQLVSGWCDHISPGTWECTAFAFHL